jgi:uncharacterized phiE125 gp8 family phage protein
MMWAGVAFKFAVAPLPSAAIAAQDLAEHLRVTSSDELPLVYTYAKAATSTIEQRLNRLLVQRQVTARASCLPPRLAVELFGGPIGEITSFTIDGDAVPEVEFELIGDSPAILVPTETWPTAEGRGLPVEIVYTAGFDEVPADIRVALLMIGADMFENRTQHVVGTSVGVNPAVDALLMPWRIAPV